MLKISTISHHKAEPQL